MEVALYRVAAEALTNAVRHSGAGHITLRLAHAPRGIRLQVDDELLGLYDAPVHTAALRWGR